MRGDRLQWPREYAVIKPTAEQVEEYKNANTNWTDDDIDNLGVLDPEQRGDWAWVLNEDIQVVVTATMDRRKKPIYIVSSGEGPDLEYYTRQTKHGARVQFTCPRAFKRYNEHKYVCDIFDKMVLDDSAVRNVQTNDKWWLPLFWALFDTAVTQTYIAMTFNPKYKGIKKPTVLRSIYNSWLDPMFNTGRQPVLPNWLQPMSPPPPPPVTAADNAAVALHPICQHTQVKIADHFKGARGSCRVCYEPTVKGTASHACLECGLAVCNKTNCWINLHLQQFKTPNLVNKVQQRVMLKRKEPDFS